MWLMVIIVVVTAAFIWSKMRFDNRNRPGHDTRQQISKPDRWGKIEGLLRENALPSTRISLVNEKPKNFLQSKIGGRPYWPKEKPYPLGEDGKKLTFIAQLNLSEISEKTLDLPSKGMLQFFIATDDLMGLTFYDNTAQLHAELGKINKQYAVIYHDVLNQNESNLYTEDSKRSEDEYSPISGESLIKFSTLQDIASPEDYRFSKIVQSASPLSEDELEYAYDQLMRSKDHKVGGYASFTQQDPREYVGKDEDWILLFQLDSESNDHLDMMWGDVGIAHFFIRKDDLKALRFDRVWYNWDCH